MKFSSRVDTSVPNQATMAMTHALAAGRAVLNLSDSNPTRHGLAPDALPDVYQANPRGPLSARHTLAEFLNDHHDDQPGHADEDRLYILSSTSQAYAWLLTLLCDTGDAVLCPAPGYPLVESIARLLDVGAWVYPLAWHGFWSIDMPEIERLLSSPDGSRVRAIIAINPNNPTGSFVTKSEIDALVTLCRRYDVALIVDEVFFDYCLDQRPHHRIAGENRVLTFSLDGLSKKLAAPQAKVGWIQVSGPATDVAEAMRRLDIIADDFLPLSDLLSAQIPRLLAEVPAQVERLQNRTRANLHTLRNLVDASKTGITTVLAPQGGWSALLRFPSLIDEDALVVDLVNNDGVSVQPGYFFTMPFAGTVSVSLLLEPHHFQTGITALLERIDKLSM